MNDEIKFILPAIGLVLILAGVLISIFIALGLTTAVIALLRHMRYAKCLPLVPKSLLNNEYLIAGKCIRRHYHSAALAV